ncbi:AfsA-related hotdog domain-containing protein [Streptomyces sp. SP17BM10]|uniref:AfsA-related hotdog domain-containing protein n=1 Tax=Streptomyces sp. SP17BM10 TaxID=3002530 RepID=UPI002E77096C|nr:AfsA-related hotdog domain-containing protein [Streptomyces sp. SP17BM10]MEE1781607.1 AfsA-related hotdog domain-containing protein [Streptomyces sp. SP17BM10]
MTDVTTMPGRPAARRAHDDDTTGSGTRHLVHCPPSWENCLLDAPGLGEEHFMLTGELPVRHPLFNDGPGLFHDLQTVTESVREIGEFVGHRYFGVPVNRTGLFHGFALTLTDLAAWRVVPGRRPRLSTEIRATPVNVVNGVPRGLDFRLLARVDGAPCATGSAGLVFLMPKLYGNLRAHNRRAVRETPELDERPVGPVHAADPAEVGRAGAANVVVARPDQDSRERLSTWVLTRGVGPVFAAAEHRSPGDERLPGLHLLESLRQSSLLAAGRARGLTAERCVLASLDVRFRGEAEAALPLRCLAEAGPVGRDAHGRPSVPVTVTLTQCRRTVAEARTVVVQDF